MNRPDDVLRYPLNFLLNAEANVRLLRLLLHEVGAPLSATETADRASLTRAGARKALNRLAKTGFIARVGTSKSQQYAIQDEDPLLNALAELFRVEYERYEQLLKRIRHAVQEMPEIHAAWIDRSPSEPGQSLDISVVASSESLSWLKEDLRGKLRGLERELDLIIEIAAYSRADAPEVSADDVTLLAGFLEEAGSSERPSEMTQHDQRDRRALRLAHAIARLLRADPSLVKRAMRHVDRLLSEDQGAAAQDLREWRQVLETYSTERLQDFITSSSSRAARLRQSSPFFAVLTAEERHRVLSHLEGEE